MNNIIPNPTVAQTLKVFADIRQSGQIFSAKFIKKDNTLREMHCRTGVKRYLKGGSLRFKPSEKGLLPVYDLKKKEYRFVNLNTVISVTYGGKTYQFAKSDR